MNIDFHLSTMFIKFYNDLKRDGITFIPDTEVAKYIFLKGYNDYVRIKMLVPIEELESEEKMKLVSECREMKGVFYTNETLIRNCKILHVINLLNNQ